MTKNVTKIGRPPIKRKAMSPAERQRRHRRKIAGRSRATGGDELHETPEIAVTKLLAAEQLPRVIWEPAAGFGAIARVLRAAGHTVITSDLRAHTPDLDFVSDFLAVTEAPEGAEMVLTNPPFSLAADFARHALTFVPRVALLLRLAFLESTTKRADLFEDGHLARIWVFRKRLPKMHRHGWTGKKAAPDEGHMWCVWDKAHNGPPTVHWL